ncbi:MAG: KpsF/GutQ family sugar-phosphate isomerase [bacterium]|nr:KpsF/GutQ family sugar-phosphate isomerase [bacterium]
MNILEQAKLVLQIEAEAISNLLPRLDAQFESAVNAILECKGRIIVTAIGKSGHIGRKIAATLASTGTPALFMHPAEGIHGDLGMITADDIVLAISNSGESEEIINILPVIKKIGASIIAMTGDLQSPLAKNSVIVLDIGVKQEADPFGLVPTSSTTATLAMGDALAIVLLHKKEFNAQDFALLHPGGSIGRELLEVSELMHTGDDNPVIDFRQTVRDALVEITEKKLGAVTVVDESGKLRGIITDGDVRRLFQRADEFGGRVLALPIAQIMQREPITVTPKTRCIEAVRIMEENPKGKPVMVLPVVDENGQPVGMIHMHDLVRKGYSVGE